MKEALPRIILTGFMCAGKTTVAHALARRLDCRLIDLDEFIATREGRSISAIISEDGEAKFREVETRALQDALEESAARIIALGGGAWTLERNRAALAEHDCMTVWLDAPFELCWQRIMNDSSLR
ncbi:MAG: AAA family ATPase, partial [Pyrinomonadaceae bacterium]|nr:AAA family ATPase [Pyrinomonadaceae bacterium]